MFGRATIRLGISPHSSLACIITQSVYYERPVVQHLKKGV